MSKTAPCPHCGSTEASEYTFDDGNDVPFYVITCAACETQGPVMRTVNDAWHHWNLGQVDDIHYEGGWLIQDVRVSGQ